MNTLFPSATAGSVCFLLITFLLSTRMMKSAYTIALLPALTATILQGFGFAALAYYSRDETRHLAFLSCFASSNMAPILLCLANFIAHCQLLRFTDSRFDEPNRVASRVNANVFAPALLSLVAATMVMTGLGLWDMFRFLSPAPIEDAEAVMQRLILHDRGLATLNTSHLMLLGGLMAFAAITILQSIHLKLAGNTGKQVLHLYACTASVNAFLLLRSSCKLYESASPEYNPLDLTGASSWYWINDALPMLIAVTLFCTLYPTQPFRQCKCPVDTEAYSGEKSEKHGRSQNERLGRIFHERISL